MTGNGSSFHPMINDGSIHSRACFVGHAAQPCIIRNNGDQGLQLHHSNGPGAVIDMTALHECPIEIWDAAYVDCNRIIVVTGTSLLSSQCQVVGIDQIKKPLGSIDLSFYKDDVKLFNSSSCALIVGMSGNLDASLKTATWDMRSGVNLTTSFPMDKMTVRLDIKTFTAHVLNIRSHCATLHIIARDFKVNANITTVHHLVNFDMRMMKVVDVIHTSTDPVAYICHDNGSGNDNDTSIIEQINLNTNDQIAIIGAQ